MNFLFFDVYDRTIIIARYSLEGISLDFHCFKALNNNLEAWLFTCSFVCLIKSSDGIVGPCNSDLFKLGTVLTYAFNHGAIHGIRYCNPGGGGGGGGTQMLFGRGCEAEASKPVPIFKGHFGGKVYPLLGIFSQENYVCVYFSDEMGEIKLSSIYSKITKVGGMFRDFPAQNRDPCLGTLGRKVTH